MRKERGSVAFQDKGQEMLLMRKEMKSMFTGQKQLNLVLTGAQDKYDSDKYESNQPLPSSQAAPNYTTELAFLG